MGKETGALKDLSARGLTVAIVMLAAVLVGAGVAVIAWVFGASVPHGLFAGGSAFAGTTVLLIRVVKFGLEGSSRR